MQQSHGLFAIAKLLVRFNLTETGHLQLPDVPNDESVTKGREGRDRTTKKTAK